MCAIDGRNKEILVIYVIYSLCVSRYQITHGSVPVHRPEVDGH